MNGWKALIGVTSWCSECGDSGITVVSRCCRFDTATWSDGLVDPGDPCPKCCWYEYEY